MNHAMRLPSDELVLIPKTYSTEVSMKRTLLLLGILALLLCGTLTALAQIPNAGFESWTAGNPDGWWTDNQPVLSWVPVTQSRTAHSGTFSVRGDVISIATGSPFAPQVASGTNMGGFAWTQRSANITGYYQFFPASGSGDRISVLGGLGKDATNGLSIAVVGGYISTAASSWTQFSLPYTYITQDVPGWAGLTFTLTGPGSASPKVGSYFLLDDLAFSGTATAVSDPNSLPNSFALEQNYPNPFNPSTTIGFAMAQPGFVTLKVYNVLGTEVASLLEGHRDAGTFNIRWNAAGFPSGMYLYRLSVTTEKGLVFEQSKKLVLQK
jgi:hypothetical protein